VIVGDESPSLAGAKRTSKAAMVARSGTGDRASPRAAKTRIEASLTVVALVVALAGLRVRSSRPSRNIWSRSMARGSRALPLKGVIQTSLALRVWRETP
jgi:hypothetical protein